MASITFNILPVISNDYSALLNSKFIYNKKYNNGNVKT